MKREELEKYIGKKVQLTLFDKEIVEGELHKKSKNQEGVKSKDDGREIEELIIFDPCGEYENICKKLGYKIKKDK